MSIRNSNTMEDKMKNMAMVIPLGILSMASHFLRWLR